MYFYALRAKLAHAATAYDRRRQNRKGHNPYALPQYFAAIDNAVFLMAAGSTPRKALCEVFNDRLLDCLLKAIGESVAVRGVDK